MGDWIKLPGGVFVNLSVILSATPKCWVTSNGERMEYASDDVREQVLSALESRCRDEDGGLKE